MVMFERVKKAQDVLDNALLEEVPVDKNGRMIVNDYRRILLRNSKALIVVTTQTREDLKTHVIETKKKIKIITNVGLSIAFVIGIAIVGFHTTWGVAGGVSVAGGVAKFLSYIFIK